MKTGAAIGVTVGVLAALALGAYAYDEIEKSKCTGTWKGLFGGGCVAPVTTVPTSTAPAAPTGLSMAWQTPTSANSVTGTLSWNAVAGATYYTVNGQNVGNVTSAVIQGIPGQAVEASVLACN